jgi:hypothetical protein
LHTGHIVPRGGETVDCFKLDVLWRFLSALAHAPQPIVQIRWCEREGNIVDVIIVIEGFCNERARLGDK